MHKPVKVLYVNGNILKCGGIEAFMMNYFRHIDSSKVHIDFLVHGYEKGVYDEEIIAAGSKILHVPRKSKHPIKYQNELKRIFSSGEYKIVHSHCDAMSGWILKIAAECAVPVRIAHSHNTQHLTSNKFKIIVNDYAKSLIPKYATHLYACSEAAGDWLFGKNAKYEVINNAIFVEKFKFDLVNRKKIRHELSIENEYVIGHIGRFDYQKNQGFLILVFAKLKRICPNCKLVFVGEGCMRNDIEELAKAYGISSDVTFMGARTDTNAIYSAFDVFVLPSHFEGLPVVGVEAQANGLKCVFSKNVTEDTKMTNQVTFLPLENIDAWVQELSKPMVRTFESINQIKKLGYDIQNEAYKLQKKYIQYYGERKI